MSAKPNMSVPAGASDAPLRPISFGDPAVIDRAPRRRHHLSAAEDAARRLSGPARPTACIIGPSAEPNRVFMAERDTRRRLAADHLRAIAGVARGISPRRCSRAAFPPRSRSSFSPAIRSITRCSRSARSMPAFPSARCRRPIRWCRKDYGKLAYLMKLLTPGLVFADDADKFADALAANVPGEPRSRRRAAPCPAAR